MAADERPAVAAGLLGGLLERLPGRLRRRLDAEPTLAESWTWSRGGAEITVASADATVVLRPTQGVVRDAEAASCTCLLAPACLHLAAVLVRLTLTTVEPEPDQAAPAGEPTDIIAPLSPTSIATPEMARAAEEMTAALGRLLDAGASTAGFVAVGDVLRAVHTCQAVGLHRAAGAGLRVAQDVGRLRDDDPAFRLRELRVDLVDGLTAANQVASGRVDRSVVGTARRAYEPVAAMRLYGLFTEPVISRSGYAGCATYLVDEAARLWVISDVVPAPPSRAQEAYGQVAGLGDVLLTHRQLARGGALVAEGRASAQGRLGRGREVRAVSATGARWSEAPIFRLFDVPLEAQLGRVWGAAAQPELERREGWGLLFITATVAGSRNGLLDLDVGGQRLLAGAAAEHEELRYRENLGTLSEMRGATVMAVARPLMDRPGQLELLAVATPDAVGAAAGFAEAWGGRANLGLDRISRGDLHIGPAPSAARPGRRTPDVMDPISRRLDRVVLGGRATLAVAARRGVDHDIARLRSRHLAAGAELLAGMATAATASGAIRDLIDGWLALAVYESAANQRLSVRRWIEG